MKYKLLLLGLLFLTIRAFPASAQQINGNITTSGSTCSTATNCVVLPLQNAAGSATITVSGTFSGTLQFEVSGDNTNFVATNAFPSNSTTAVTSTTAAGTWTVNVSSKVVIRVRASALASGTAIVNINATPASANSISGGGSGPGGGVTEVDTSGCLTGGPITTTGTITSGATCALTTNPLSQFAATTSAQLAGVLSDETGTGAAVFAGSPALTGTPTAPTAAGGTNTTQVATTAFVIANAGSGNTTSTSLTTNVMPKANGANSIINSSVSDNGTTVSTAEPISVGASVTTTADGTHPSSVSLVGNTTLPTLVTNTVTLLGPPSATPTAWSLQVPTALPTTTDLFSCVVTGTNCQLTDTGIASGNVVTSAASLANTALVVGSGGAQGTATGNADFTYATHTLSSDAAGLLDLSAETGANAHKVPVQAGAAPTANGAISYDSTCNDETFGTNSATRYLPFTLRANASADQITSAGAFATTLSVPGGCLFAKSIITVQAHGVYTTTATATPLLNLEVNAGGTTGICPASGSNVTMTTGQTSQSWDINCKIQIVTTGGPGTAYAYGGYTAYSNTGSVIATTPKAAQNTSTVSYTTTGSQTVAIQETATLVSGQTYNLQYLTVDVSPE